MGIWNLTGGQFNAHKHGINTLFDCWTEAEQLTPWSTGHKSESKSNQKQATVNFKSNSHNALHKSLS